jgi:hypothetical protein
MQNPRQAGKLARYWKQESIMTKEERIFAFIFAVIVTTVLFVIMLRGFIKTPFPFLLNQFLVFIAGLLP